jgi:hypothetical protein
MLMKLGAGAMNESLGAPIPAGGEKGGRYNGS